MESVLVWLVVLAVIFPRGHTQCLGNDGTIHRRGGVLVSGNHQANFTTASISVCTETGWRAVCDDQWNIHGARVLCQQIGFHVAGTAQHCGDSCFGCSNNRGGGLVINCRGTENGILQCPLTLRTQCRGCAGVICIKERTICPTCPTSAAASTDITIATTCAPPEPTAAPTACAPPELTEAAPTTSSPPDPMPAVSMPLETTPPRTAFTGDKCTCSTTEGEVTANSPAVNSMVGGALQSCPSLAALGGGLGALTAILAILLVGVVIGCVWTYHRRPKISELNERPQTMDPEVNYTNPTYSPISPLPVPSVQYSSIGPRGAQPLPASATAHYETMETMTPQERRPHMPEQRGRPGREEDSDGQEDTGYYTLGNTRRGISVSPAPAQPVSEPMDTEYSKLHHQ